MARLNDGELSQKALQCAVSVMKCPCDFILGTKHNPFSGGECTIFALESRSCDRLGIRLEHTPSPDKVMKEVQHLEALRTAMIPHVPELIGYSISTTPSPFIALKWADGTALRWTDSSLKPEYRDRILKTVAQVTMDLLKVQEQGCAALDWITGKISRTRIAQAQKGRLSDISVEDCQALLNCLKVFHIPDLNHAPHVMLHGDLQASNIIINDAMEVECIIDWGFSAMVPLQYAAVYPRFLTNEPQIIRGAVIWPRITPTMDRDRQFYLQCIEDIASHRGGIAQDYYEILAREDEIERYWWLSAVGRLDIMKAMRSRDKAL